jgi:hypothetical protein
MVIQIPFPLRGAWKFYDLPSAGTGIKHCHGIGVNELKKILSEFDKLGWQIR